jgi:hypothetical protein
MYRVKSCNVTSFNYEEGEVLNSLSDVFHRVLSHSSCFVFDVAGDQVEVTDHLTGGKILLKAVEVFDFYVLDIPIGESVDQDEGVAECYSIYGDSLEEAQAKFEEEFYSVGFPLDDEYKLISADMVARFVRVEAP